MTVNDQINQLLSEQSNSRDNQQSEAQANQSNQDKTSLMMSIGRGLLNGVTSGFADELMDGAHRVIPSIPNGDSLRRYEDLDEQQHPYASGAGNIVGGLAQLAVLPEGKIAEVMMLPKSNIIRAIAQGAVSGVGNGNHLTSDATSGSNSNTGDSVGDAIKGGIAGLALGMAGKGLGVGADITKNALTPSAPSMLNPYNLNQGGSLARLIARAQSSHVTPDAAQAMEDQRLKAANSIGQQLAEAYNSSTPTEAQRLGILESNMGNLNNMNKLADNTKATGFNTLPAIVLAALHHPVAAAAVGLYKSGIPTAINSTIVKNAIQSDMANGNVVPKAIDFTITRTIDKGVPAVTNEVNRNEVGNDELDLRNSLKSKGWSDDDIKEILR